MTIHNIIDRRTNKFNVTIEAILEPSSHDNYAKGATQFKENDNDLMVQSITHTTINNVIRYSAQEYKYPVTLFMYDIGTTGRGDIRTLVDNGGRIEAILYED
jgi:hypothetical protein